MGRRIEVGLVELPVITYKDEDMYVSEIPVINVASQGKTVEESLANLKEAVELYFEGEDVRKILKERLPTPTSVMTTTITFDMKSKQVIRTPISTSK